MSQPTLKLSQATSKVQDFLTQRQAGRCEICGQTPKSSRDWHLDHNHVTGEVRGFLCHRCNIRLGHVEALLREGLLERAVQHSSVTLPTNSIPLALKNKPASPRKLDAVERVEELYRNDPFIKKREVVKILRNEFGLSKSVIYRILADPQVF